MKRRLITRRAAIVTGLASIGGIVLARGPKQLPPTYGNLLRMGDDLTYAAHRALLPQRALVKEYRESDITSFPAIGTTNFHANVDTWKLSVEGLVARPQTFSLADLKRLPSRTQITRHTCEEGWSAIAKWTGVPLGVVLDAAGILPAARYVLVQSLDDFANSIDLLDAFHPQTILAYGMNGSDLSVPHGAPLRLRVERQLGYKGLKYLRKLVVINEFDDGGTKGDLANGWAWYTGI
ncbi:MAG TPA: molybdopterin-dependent oxidoreductase [Vicinamibacterales bacterium]|nr:molybdopterin-dependent oxidoreductase [Vicinamibacterales bacterium]